MDKQQKQILILLGTFVVVVAFFFLLKPVAMGYGTYKDVKDLGVEEEYIGNMAGLQARNNELSSRVSILEAREKELQNLLTNAGDKAEEYENNFVLCQEEFDKHKNISKQLADSLAEEKAEVQTDLSQCEEGITESARRICCVEKLLTNPDIQSYAFDDGEIRCLTNTAGNAIMC